MRRPFANLVVCLLTLCIAIPESAARRLGGGGSVGRQAPMYRQRSTPAYQPRQPVPAAPAYVPRQAPEPVRQSAPVPAPAPPNLARQGSGVPWGGMLGGALVGLGLGSLMSSHDRSTNAAGNGNGNGNADGNRNGNGNVTGNGNSNGNLNGTADPATPRQQSGGGASGTDAVGAGQAGQPVPATTETGRSGFGSILLWGLLALVAFMLFRRSRAGKTPRL